MAGQAFAAVQGALGWLKRLGVEPEAAPPSAVAVVALVPPVVAGVVLFRLTAVEVLGVALAAALAAHVAARLLGQPLAGTPLLPAVVGVAMVGSGAPLPWAAAVAVAAAAFELGRARFVPAARLQVGLLAYALVLLASRGGPAVYVSPAGVPGAEPIRLWLQLAGGGQTPVDPVRLYVGNVAGPVFATSMLAVAIGAAWLWYSRRLSLLVVLMFLAGALVPILVLHWSPAYQLDSGPLWFAAALVLADRRTLPASKLGRPLVGLLAGLLALGARTRGFAIESAVVAVAGMQVLTVAVQGL
ncbi:MAG TPA: RnfABCDGE type electron transport complex subunit D, partial [Candidatus Dormibacteraeota bacterium]|nr:RnfABCDGE type electron transport complex subunit D [Candidatus Dormibacteraeota bacterium]